MLTYATYRYSMDLWITLVAISSATWAIYCLITFYLAMQEEIENSVNNALGKFLVVKAVVFLCFYQVRMCVCACVWREGGMQGRQWHYTTFECYAI